jgi:DNA-binding SARP family transcriptional activator
VASAVADEPASARSAGSIAVRILGPLEIASGDRTLPVRGSKQRALLALLVLRAGEVVGSDRLIDELWGSDPPESGAAALQVRVSQLRKTLELDGPGGLIVTRPPGYVLRIDRESIDACRFERLLAEGRALLADGEPEHAGSRLRQGLALWRGPALADLAYERFAQAEIARLEELRLAALEARIEADLALGRHAELVGELDALAAAHPLREPLRGLQMRALYRAGRQADALAAYRDARHLLVDELGIEPGEELRRLEQAILRQDPTLSPRSRPPVAPPGPPGSPPRPPTAERKVVTVLFADLVGSTRLTATHDPERAHALLERFYDGMAEEIAAAGGTVEKFVGDAVMAVFGAPVAQEDHAERALHAALSMQRRMVELFGDRLVLRVGVSTGEVVVGGGRTNGSFVTGVVVNACARLEQAAGPGEILVSARTARAAGAAFEFGPPAVLEAKGLPEGIPCRRLLRALALTQRSAGALAPAFVGREAQLDLLRATYARVAAEGRPALVTVVGDAGVGKSRLVRELWDWLAGQTPEPLRRTSRCFPLGKRVTYAPLRDVLQEELGLLANDPPDVTRGRLGEREILGLALGLDVASGLHPLVARDRLREAWVDFLSDLAATGPVVLLVEDLHWAQDLLVELLETAVREVAGPLMVVATARPELVTERPSWGQAHRDATTIWLEPLSRDETELLLEQLLGAEPPCPIGELLVARAEGNPFFVEELIEQLIDEGAIVRGAEGLDLCELPAELVVPDSIQSVLAARLDLLPPREKAALQAAAVIGRVFWRGPLSDLLDGELPDFAVLEARNFVHRRPVSSIAGERELAFKHALTRDVAYASLPKAKRARLHAAFARWLEQAGQDRDVHAPLLAYHYSEAARPEDADLVWADEPRELERLRASAVAWLRRAAELAARRYDLDESLALLGRALELEPDEPLRAELWRSIGHMHALNYDGEAFWTAMLESLTACSDRRRRADAYGELAFHTAIRSGMWRQRPATELVDEWIARALELAEPGTEARARALLALGFWDSGSAAAAAIEASAIAETLGDPELRSDAWDLRAAAAFAAGEFDLGSAFAERRFELLDEIADPDARADIHSAPIAGCIWSGRFREARRLARCHDEITQPLTPHHRMHGVATLCEVEELLGGWENVRGLAERTRATVTENAGTPCVRNARSLLLVATADAVLGDDAESRALEQEAESIGIDGFGHVLDTPRLRLAIARGDLGRVEELLARSPGDRGWFWGWLALSTLVTRLDGLAALGDREELEREVPRLLRPNTYIEPFALRALGVVREDVASLGRALERFQALGLAWHAGETERLLG